MRFNSAAIKGVLLDLDDTLYNYAPCNEAGINAACEFLAARLPASKDLLRTNFDIAREKIKNNLLKELGFETAASHSRLLYFQQLLENLTGKSNLLLATEADSIFWKTYFKRMKLLPGARKFLKLMRKQKKRVAIVTDMIHSTQLEKIRCLKIENLIDVIVSSEETGKEKPHPASLLRALKKIDCAPNEAVFIGESEKKDAAAALAAGVTPIIIRYQPENGSLFFVENFKNLIKLFC